MILQEQSGSPGTLEEKVSAWRSAKLSGFDQASLVWLACVPAWTDRLAREAKFPVGAFSTLDDFLQAAEDAAICQRNRDNSKDLAQRCLKTLLALWARTAEVDRVEVSGQLRQQAELLPEGPERRRILREVEITAPASPSGLSRLINQAFSKTSAAADLGARARIVNVFQNALADVTVSGPRAMSARVLQAAAQTLGAEIVSSLVPALVPVAAAAAQWEPVRNFFFQATSQIDAEQRARLFLYAASNTQDSLRWEFQSRAVELIQAIPDPETRAEAYLETLGDLENLELRRTAAGSAMSAIAQLESIEQRTALLTALLPYVSPDEMPVSTVTETIVPAILSGTDPVQKTAALASVARFLAKRQDTAAVAVGLADSAGDPTSRAHILMEAVAAGPGPLADIVLQTIDNLPPLEFEKALTSLSPDAGAAVSRLRANDVFVASINAAQAGRFAVAGRISTFLPPTGRASPAERILDSVQQLPSPAERLDALAQLAQYLPERVMRQAWRIASRLETDSGFAVTESMRASVLAYVRETSGAAFVRDTVQVAGKAIRDAISKGVDASPATARWAAIAELARNPRDASELLTKQVRDTVEHGNPGEALDLLNVAAPLVKLIGAELEPAMAMSRQVVQLAYRRAADERHLRKYLERNEQDQAFKELIEGPDNRWALHYLGMGGAGKTMLLRHLTARLAVRNGVPLATTRVDFDHISPDYPVLKPGELLASLAEELRFYGGSGQEERYQQFVSSLNEVHGILSAVPPPEDPLKNIHSTQFQQLLREFAGLLENLPKPVIFILDTCEELAKLEPEGAILPSVEATFQILEWLQDMVPTDSPGTPNASPTVASTRGGGLRVVFAGRRLLAQAGDLISESTYRWSAQTGSLSERNKLLPQAKEYLRLHIVRGFTEKEVDDYFTLAKVEPGAERKAAVLGVSREAGANTGIAWHDPADQVDETQSRYNPFDVSLYAEWMREKKEAVTAEMIGSGETDPYVRARIVDRILDEGVRNALPAAILLRRFDADMLRPVIAEENELQRIYRDLGGQEWIEYQQNALQVQTNLLERVERYYSNQSRVHLLDAAREALAPALADQLREAMSATDPFAGLSIAKIDAALRLLPAREAALLWDEIDRTVTDRANWPWASNVCRYLLSEHNTAGADNSPLRAAVRATMAAVAIHTPDSDPTTLNRWWKEVASTAKLHPVNEIAEWLEMRARIALGLYGSGPEAVLAARWADEHSWRWQQLVAAVIARAAKTQLFLLADLTGDLPVEISGFLACMDNDVEEAKTLAAKIGPGPTLQRWADWHAPVSVRDRIRLELLGQGRTHVTNEELKQWGEEAAASLNNVDSERLLARTIQLRLDYEVPAVPEIAPPNTIYDAVRKPTCDAHRSAPALFAIMAEAQLARGDDVGAEALLATKFGDQDEEAAKAARRGKALVSRRMRRRDALDKVADQYAIEIPDSTEFHYWWCRQLATEPDDLAKLVEAAERQAPDCWRRKDGSVDPHSALDALELDLLGKRLGRETDHSGPLFAELNDLKEIHDFRISVRRFVNNPGDRFIPTMPEAPRRAAEIFLEEGEMLALRLPEQAKYLFPLAAGGFRDAGDAFGEFRCAISAAYSDPHSTTVDHFDRIATAYAKCRERSPDLPEWSRFGQSNVWPGWAARVWSLEAIVTEPVPSLLTANSRSRLQAYCGSVPQFEVGVVKPLAFAPPPPAAKPSRNNWLMFLGFIVIGLIIMGLIAAAKWMYHHQESVAFVGGTVAAIGVYAWLLIAWFMPPLMRFAFLTMRPVLRIEPSIDGRISLSFDIKVPPRFRWFIREKFRKMTTVTVDLPLTRPYARPEGPGWEELRKQSYLTVMTSPICTRFPVITVVERSLERYPWEAWLNLLIGRGWFGEALQVVRPGNPKRGTSAADDPLKGVDLQCRSGLAPALETAWKEVSTVRTTPTRRESSNILHAVGTVRKTASGMRFLVGKGGGKDDTATWGPENFDGYSVVVLQEEPAERVRRLDVDRDRTADMREWAFTIFASNGQAVILLPAMPLALAGQVVKKMARRLRRGWSADDLHPALDLVSDMQSLIRKFDVPKGKDGVADLRAGMSAKEISSSLRELSLEVTLFSCSTESDPGNRFTGFRRSNVTLA